MYHNPADHPERNKHCHPRPSSEKSRRRLVQKQSGKDPTHRLSQPEKTDSFFRQKGPSLVKKVEGKKGQFKEEKKSESSGAGQRLRKSLSPRRAVEPEKKRATPLLENGCQPTRKKTPVSCVATKFSVGGKGRKTWVGPWVGRNDLRQKKGQPRGI